MIQGFVVHLFGTGGAATWTAYKSVEPPPHWLSTGEDLLPRGTYDSSDILTQQLAPGYQNPNIVPPILETAMYMDWFTCMDPTTGAPSQFQGVSVGPSAQYDVEIFSNGNPKWYTIDKMSNILQPQQDPKPLLSGTVISDHPVTCLNAWIVDINITTVAKGLDNWWAMPNASKFGLLAPLYVSETSVLYGEPIFINFNNQRIKIPQL